MSRFVGLIRSFSKSTVLKTQFTPKFVPASTPAFKFAVRAFGDDHHHHDAHDSTFLDAKEVTDRILTVVSNFEKVNREKLSPDSKFADLDLDSLDVVEIVMAIEEEFCIEIPDSEADKIHSVADAVKFISLHPMAK